MFFCLIFNIFFTHQKWKKNWFVLYPASQNGIARLEFFDSPLGGGTGGGGGSGSGSNEKTRKLDKKIIRLSECISILPALTETCPKENMAAFCVETNDKTHIFAAEQSTAKDWMELMCDIAFQVSLQLQSHVCQCDHAHTLVSRTKLMFVKKFYTVTF